MGIEGYFTVKNISAFYTVYNSIYSMHVACNEAMSQDKEIFSAENKIDWVP
jgi:hypothetical protein